MEKVSVIVVFSHLRWNWVWQRPQHLLTRLARSHSILFVEEPVQDSENVTPRWEFEQPAPNVQVCRPRIPEPEQGFHPHQGNLLNGLVDDLARQESLVSPLVWLYTPMALPLGLRLKPAAMVYDVMDELSLFKGAPPELVDLEDQAYRSVDLVFTGGPSLYAAKRHRHPNVHCFPSSVDAGHFGRARAEDLDHVEQARLPRPRLGYFGVVDERVDLTLLETLAWARPGWQIAVVGPVAKIDPACLPRRSNISYFGQRTYRELPEFLAGWDVCLLPFARNDATRFISPTKTLEYMAAEKPIVSTPLTDVAGPYGDCVLLGDTAGEFLSACDRALNESGDALRQRKDAMRAVLAESSWDRTAAAMQKLIAQVLRDKRRRNSILGPAQRERRETVIIGAGPTGLSAAYHSKHSLLLEANDSVGGWCRSLVDRGFTFDFAGHIMFSNDAYVHEMYRRLLGDNVHWQDREAWVYSKQTYTRYPFQGALYGLPPDVIKECIMGAIECRYGAASHGEGRALPSAPARSHNGTDLRNAAVAARDSAGRLGDVKDCCGDGVLETTARLAAAHPDKSRNGHANFEEFIYRVWGSGIAKHFAIPYNRKLWAVDLKEMETSWLGGRVPLPDLEEMIEGALRPVPKPMGPNARFGYPLRGGFQALMNGFLPFVRDRLRLNTRVTEISFKRRLLTLADGSQMTYRDLISTMPLPQLVECLGDEAPMTIRKAVESLRHVSVRCVNIGVGREALTEKHWIYFSEDTVFHRIFVQGNASPHCNPPGGFGLTCEITYSPAKPLPCEGDDLIQRCIDDCRKVGLVGAGDPILCANQIDMPYAYVVYDHGRAESVKMIRDWLAGQGIILAGRYSEWEYYNSDHAFLAGRRAAEAVAELARGRARPRQIGRAETEPSAAVTSGE